MAKKIKTKIVTEHILTLEKARSLLYQFLWGIFFLFISASGFYALFTSNCCSVDDGCSFFTSLGRVLVGIILVAILLLGVTFLSSPLWDDTYTQEIKVKKRIE